MENFEKHILSSEVSAREALIRLDKLARDGTIFIVDEKRQLLGSITDGDIRRTLIEGANADENILNFTNRSPKFIRKEERALKQLMDFRQKEIYIVPVLEKKNDTIVNVLNLKQHRSYLPIDAVIMAGGKGKRLRPLTNDTPKPLLYVGDVPIIERNINRLALYGIDDISISINYLGDQLETYFGNGSEKGISIRYVRENEPLGTLGSVGLIDEFKNDYVLVMNSDLLTNIDFESFFLDFIESNADFSVLSIPYKVDVPYAVFETDNGQIRGLKEKPRYTYYSNGGIYLMKRETLVRIPNGKFYNTTDLIESLIEEGKVVRSYPLVDYWLDIGNHEDFKKAQTDVHHIKF